MTRTHRALAVVAAAALVAGCSTGDSAGSAGTVAAVMVTAVPPSADPVAAPAPTAITIDAAPGLDAPVPTAAVGTPWALAYLGVASPAPVVGAPVVIGFVNQEAAVSPAPPVAGSGPAATGALVAPGVPPTVTPSFPETGFAAEAMVGWINAELGGVQGRPLALRRCRVTDAAGAAWCAERLAADPEVVAVVTGALTVGGAAFHDAIGGRKPVLVTNPLTAADATADGAVALGVGVLGVAPALGVFAARTLQPTVAVVVHTDDDAGATAATALFEPVLAAAGVDTTRVAVPVAATPDDVASALAAAPLGRADLVVVLATGPACTAVADAVRESTALRPATPVATTMACTGAAMVRHLGGDPALTAGTRPVGLVPDGWYVGAPGRVPWSAGGDAGLDTILGALATFGPAGTEAGGFATATAGALLALVRVLGGLPLAAPALDPAAVGPALDPAAVGEALRSFDGVVPGQAGSITCGRNPVLRALCADAVGIARFEAGTWRMVADPAAGQAVRPFATG